MIKLDRILFPTDFSDSSAYAASFAVSFASDYGAKLHVLHVVEMPLDMPDIFIMKHSDAELEAKTSEHVRQELESASAPEALKKIEYEVDCVKGKPFAEIVKFAREKEIDMIVMGTRGRTALENVLLGSTAEKVLRKAAVPVFVVRRPGHRFVIPPLG